MTYHSTLAAAIALATERSFPVYPLMPGCLRQRPGILPREAATDPQTITILWQTYPNSNIATPTGRKTGLIGLSLQGDQAEESLRRFSAPWPDTLTVVMPTGDRTMLYRYPSPGVRSRLPLWRMPGLGLFSNGCYVAMPGSLCQGRPVVWADPDAPIAELPPQLVAELRTAAAR
jgi:bifunctional DNA primase/polymerase-like protein